MTIQEILNIDYDDMNKLDKRTLAKLTSILGSAANKRYKRMSAHEIKSPAYYAMDKGGGRITTTGKDINKLRKEFKRAKSFLEDKTSTAKGFADYRKETFERIGGKLTISDEKLFWEAYNKMIEKDSLGLKAYGSAQLQQWLRNEVTNTYGPISVDGLIKKGKRLLTHAYEQLQQQQEDFETDFFGNDKGLTVEGNNSNSYNKRSTDSISARLNQMGTGTTTQGAKDVLSERKVHKKPKRNY